MLLWASFIPTRKIIAPCVYVCVCDCNCIRLCNFVRTYQIYLLPFILISFYCILSFMLGFFSLSPVLCLLFFVCISVYLILYVTLLFSQLICIIFILLETERKCTVVNKIHAIHSYHFDFSQFYAHQMQ